MSSKYILRSCRKSEIAPFVRGESWELRHARRLSIAINHQNVIEDWLEARDGTLQVTNNGKHWRIRLYGYLWQWWPETGRIIRNAMWGKCRKAHDVYQLRDLLTD